MRLHGGTANHGRVLRVGDAVQRPAGAHTPSVHAFLHHLHEAGFRGVPTVLGTGEHTELLSYLPGRAAVEPLAPWALTADAVSGVGELLRRFHEASHGFDGSGLPWQRPIPGRWRGPLVTHNDLNPANVVFAGGAPWALIDFDLAAPATAAWDLAVTACFWAPLRERADVLDDRRDAVFDRLVALLDGYRAPRSLRRDVVEACGDANAWIAGVIEDASHRGHPAFGRLWADQAQVYARASEWLVRNADVLDACVG